MSIEIPPGLPPGIQYSSGDEGPTATCFRCGVCCTEYQVPVDQTEVNRIADSLGLSLALFSDKYIDPHWYRPGSFLLRHCDGACIFLERGAGRSAYCLIHSVRPAACRDWTPSLYRRECRAGLTKYWQLTVDSSGQLQGSEQALRLFQTFIKSLV